MANQLEDIIIPVAAAGSALITWALGSAIESNIATGFRNAFRSTSGRGIAILCALSEFILNPYILEWLQYDKSMPIASFCIPLTLMAIAAFLIGYSLTAPRDFSTPWTPALTIGATWASMVAGLGVYIGVACNACGSGRYAP